MIRATFSITLRQVELDIFATKKVFKRIKLRLSLPRFTPLQAQRLSASTGSRGNRYQAHHKLADLVTAEETMIQIIALFLLVSAELSVSTNPGIKARVSKKGIDYANGVAQRQLKQMLQTLKIPDFSHRSKKTSIRLWDIDVKRVYFPNSNVQLVPNRNGLSWSITNFGISIYARYKAKKKVLLLWLRNSGRISVSVSGVNLKEAVRLGRDRNTGRPTVSHDGCSSSIGHLKVRFHGRWAWLINLFRRRIAKNIKKSLNPMICDQIAKLIRERVSPSLTLMNVTAELADHFYIDYSLVESPIVTSKYIDILYKGAVLAKSNSRNAPYSPQPIPAVGYDKHMMHFWVTQYTFNTLLYQAHANGLLKYSVTKGKLPSFLDTTCDAACIGKIMPHVGERYPSSTVEVSMQSATMPEIKLTTNKCMVNLSVLMALTARTSSDVSTDIASVNVTLSLAFVPSIKSQRLTGYFPEYSISVSDVNFHNGQVLGTPTMLDEVLTKVFGLTVIPKLNALGDRGVNLPVSETMRLTNTYVDMKQGYIGIGTDVEHFW